MLAASVALCAVMTAAAPSAPSPAAPGPVAPHASFNQLTSANGFTAVIYDAKAAKLVSFREHTFRDLAEGRPVRDLAGEARFGLRVGGKATWLSDAGGAQARFLPGTGIIEATQKVGDLEAVTYLYAPYDAPAPVGATAVWLMKVVNRGTAPLAMGDALYSMHDLRLGDGSAERVTADPKRAFFVERGPSGLALLHSGLDAPKRLAAGPGEPTFLAAPLQDLPEAPAPATSGPVVTAYQWSLEGLAPGQERWAGAVLTFIPKPSPRASTEQATWLKGRGAAQLLADERANWEKWHAKSVEPAKLSDDERAVYRQALAVLRMGQVREPNDRAAGYLPYGQILASLPPGKWNIAWVRDGAVAIRALLASGHAAEARDGLAFFLNARAGLYVCCDKSGKPYVGRPYRISVTRYFGNGTEESDFNEDGANIEWDDFGMFLDALDAYEQASGDATLAAAHWKDVTTQVADVLVALVGKDGLLPADSSIWETHWENGKRQRWAWSHLYAALGLKGAAAMAERRGKTDLAQKYRATAARLQEALEKKFVGEDQFLRGRIEPTEVPEDGAATEAFVRRLLPGDGPVAKATLARLHEKLLVKNGRGYRRNLGPSEYDAREWIFIDLMMASAFRRAGMAERAEELVAWVTAQARLNYDVVAENFHPETGDYAGEIPMVGFGAGAYVLALFDR